MSAGVVALSMTTAYLGAKIASVVEPGTPPSSTFPFYAFCLVLRTNVERKNTIYIPFFFILLVSNYGGAGKCNSQMGGYVASGRLGPVDPAGRFRVTHAFGFGHLYGRVPSA